MLQGWVGLVNCALTSLEVISDEGVDILMLS